MEERLIKLLCKVECDGADRREGGCPYRQNTRCNRVEKLDMCVIENIAGYLIANGVIVPPCKVGDTVYIPYLSTVIEKKVCSIVVQKPFFTVYCGGTSLRFSEEDFGKTVFLTREDAERALAERSDKT